MTQKLLANFAEVFSRTPPGHGKSWNLGRPFSRPGKSWKIAKVKESHGK